MIGNSTVAAGATWSPTGGSTITFRLGKVEGGNAHFYVEEDNSLLTRREIIVSAKAPKASAGAPGGYTQFRPQLFLKWPVTLANGNTTVETARVELGVDPESNDTRKGAILELLTHFLQDADFQSLWLDGSTA